ncbi:MAG: hypothetical protein K0S41_467 [Anaerocolumna sp.]|jgi:hypothetical protein|nr:hypothetical protein [Anaerocolumna sp.]
MRLDPQREAKSMLILTVKLLVDSSNEKLYTDKTKNDYPAPKDASIIIFYVFLIF